MVKTEHGIKFAIHIITSHFGKLVAKVCDTLLRKGPLTLRLLIRFTELNSSQVNNSLLILIQHNCVQAFTAFSEGEFGDSQADTQYSALFNNILHRIRFSKFLAIASEKLENDKDCEGLLEGLLQNGRLTMDQMVERAQSSKHAKNRSISDIVHGSLFKLLTARFVERCPVSKPMLSAFVEKQPPPKKRGAKAAKVTFEPLNRCMYAPQVSESPKTIEQHVLEAARPIEVLRFSIGELDVETKRCEQPSPKSGLKRKHGDLDIDQESGDTTDFILWRANFEEFIRCLRHKACIENVRSKFDDGVTIVLSAILEATRSSEKIVKTELTVPLSLDNIFEEVIKNEVGRSMTLDRVEASLSMLGCLGMDDYQINLKNIIEQAQIEEIESVVFKRYGQDAYRMFRFLSKNGGLVETDRISESAFVEKMETPKILYRMWKDEYLYMEKVAIPASRFSQLWRVDKYNLWEHVLDEMYHASLNLQQRLAYEMEQDKELLSLPTNKRGGPLEKRYNRLRNVRLLLESSLLKLDDALMLFHDF